MATLTLPTKAASVANAEAQQGAWLSALKTRFDRVIQSGADEQRAQIAEALELHDEGAVIELLGHAGPRVAARLWDAALPGWISADQYLDTLKTAPNEAWKVNWSYGFDTRYVERQVTLAMPALKPLLRLLTHVRKEFPAEDNTRTGQLTGSTTFGYEPGRPSAGKVTPNRVRMNTHRDGRTTSSAILTYSELPGFDRTTGVGIIDELRPLTPNVVLGKGRIAEYSDADLHGRANRPRPFLSRLLSKATGNVSRGVEPPVLRFWMQRVAT